MSAHERVLEVLRRDVVFVAHEHGLPAGYVTLRREEDGPIVAEQLFVAPGHERRGIAAVPRARTLIGGLNAGDGLFRELDVRFHALVAE